MLKRYPAGPGRTVWLTDSPAAARELGRTEPVIGILGRTEPGLWSGVPYLAESEEALTEEYACLAWHRFYRQPLVILEGEDWILREIGEKDLGELGRLYEDPSVRRFLESPFGDGGADAAAPAGFPGRKGEETEKRLRDWFEAYRHYVYEADGPAMWVLTDRKGQFLGRLGLESKCVGGADGYFLGYALMPEARGRGYITRAAPALLSVLWERWEIDTVYLACAKENQASLACAGRLGFHFICRDQETLVFSISVSMPSSTPRT